MIAMFFLMDANSCQIIEHIWSSEIRFFMTLIIGGAMIINHPPLYDQNV